MDARHILSIESVPNYAIGLGEITGQKKPAMISKNTTSSKAKDLGRIINSLWNIELDSVFQDIDRDV